MLFGQIGSQLSEKKPKSILISGGSRGIGAATAKLAAERGYDVCFSFRSNEVAAEKVCRTIEGCGQRALAIRADFAAEADIVDLWKRAIETFRRVDVLVNNVGILEQQSRLVDFEIERLDRIFRVNVIGSMISAREAVRHMSSKLGGGGGTIVNVSSVAARLGAPNEYIDYAASKAALDAMTIGLAKEVAGEDVRVVGVRPGSTHTDIHASGGEANRVERVAKSIPMRRGGQPEEIAESIVWLASDQARYVTGAILDVAGGV